MHPQISTLHDLQKEDRRLSVLEHRLRAIPDRSRELDADLKRLEQILEDERRKFEETREFRATQEHQLLDEEELMRQSKIKLGQATTTREVNATKREIDATRRMATARSQELRKLGDAVSIAEDRIASMTDSLEALRTEAEEEHQRQAEQEVVLKRRIRELRDGRGRLTRQIDQDTLRQYERIRTRRGGLAFVASSDNQCSACKMQIPHQLYVRLMRGDEILSCENCGRLLYWAGHFPESNEARP